MNLGFKDNTLVSYLFQKKILAVHLKNIVYLKGRICHSS